MASQEQIQTTRSIVADTRPLSRVAPNRQLTDGQRPFLEKKAKKELTAVNIRAICGDKHIWAPSFFILRQADGRYEIRALQRIPQCEGRRKLEPIASWSRKDLGTFLEAKELALKFTLRDRDFNNTEGCGPWFKGLVIRKWLAKFRSRHQRRHPPKIDTVEDKR